MTKKMVVRNFRRENENFFLKSHSKICSMAKEISPSPQTRHQVSAYDGYMKE